MALLTTYSNTNLVIDSGLVVTYANTLISGSWSWTSANVSGAYGYMREYHRRARQSFRYVGMTKEAADSCRAAMVAKYTRSFRMSKWNDACMNGEWIRQSGGSQPMAEVSVSHNDDGSYDVVVNVNEDDAMMAMEAGSMDFRAEKTRAYEGGESEGS